MVKWFKSYLTGRMQMVRGGQLTLPMTCGVPQGSLIGPCLFTLFMNDLPGFITHGQSADHPVCGRYIASGQRSCNETGLASLRHRLELTMRELQSWFATNSLKMNEKKTSFLLIGSKLNLKATRQFKFCIGNSDVQA